MSKRLTDSNKWDDPWFRRLPPKSKLLFLYLCDSCDLAGFKQRDDEMFAFILGCEPAEISCLLADLEKSVLEKDGWLWIKNLLFHQKNLPLNPLNNAHKHIIGILNLQVSRFGFEVLEEKIGALKGLLSPLGKGIGNGKDKGKGEEHEKGKFQKPMPEQVEEAFKDKGLKPEFALLETAKFFDYYESVGWVVGATRKPMKNWRGAVGTWFGKMQEKGNIKAALVAKPKVSCAKCDGRGYVFENDQTKKCECRK